MTAAPRSDLDEVMGEESAREFVRRLSELNMAISNLVGL